MGWNNLLPVITAALLAGAISSCVTPPPPRFVSDLGASQDKFMQDRYACLKETQQPTSAAFVGGDTGSARSVVEPSCGAFNACLAARGYSQSETGPLTVPSEAVIRCHR